MAGFALPEPLGKGIHLSTHEFQGQLYMNIRKYYQDRPTRFGVTLNFDEAFALNDILGVSHMLPGQSHDLSCSTYVKFSRTGGGLAIGKDKSKELYMTQDVVQKLREQVPELMKLMTAAHQKKKQPRSSPNCDWCGSIMTSRYEGVYDCRACDRVFYDVLPIKTD